MQLTNILLRQICYQCIYIAFLLSFSFNVHAAGNDGFFELSHSTSSDTIDNARTLALYSPFYDRRREQVYAGLRITQFDTAQTTNDNTVWRIFLGATIEYTISPFIEIGTDLLGLFLLDNDDENNDCLDENKKCRVDGYLRIGFRSVIHDNLILGAFHETISFGDFHSELKGDHSYFGVSVGTKF